MKLKRCNLLAVLLLLFNNTHGQDTSQYKVITYDAFKSSTIDPNKDVKIFKNNIKWNVGMLGRGAFILEYERLISKRFTLETGIGLTYKDFILEGTYGAGEDATALNNVNSDNGRKISPGFSLEFSPRIYPKEGNFEGFFVSPLIRYRNYNLDITDPSDYDSNSATGTYDFGYKILDMAFLIGYQWESFFLETMSEYYFGVGYRQNKYKSMDSDSFGLIFHDKTETYPCLLFGCKIGITY